CFCAPIVFQSRACLCRPELFFQMSGDWCRASPQERILMLSHIDAQEQIEDLRKRLSRSLGACRPLRRRPAAARARRRPAGRQRCALLGGGAAVWHDVGPYAAGRTPPVARTARGAVSVSV
ncbi:unnamed protein product, partial [Prorocentrum cordatum]